MCRQCKRRKVKIIEVELKVFEVDGRTVMTDRKFVGCGECLDSMDSFVRWIVKNSEKRVGIYQPDLESRVEQQYLIATAELHPVPPE
jgi:hypothetical protein